MQPGAATHIWLPGQLELVLHAPDPVHDTSHAHDALQETPLSQLPSPAHVTSHRLDPHMILFSQLPVPPHETSHEPALPHDTEPRQLPSPSHVIVHLEALPHDTIPLQSPVPSQWISHGIPDGQLTDDDGESNTQVSSSHTPPSAGHNVSQAPGSGASTVTQ